MMGPMELSTSVEKKNASDPTTDIERIAATKARRVLEAAIC